MRTVALEEHFILPDILSRIPSTALTDWGWPASMPPHMRHGEKLADLDTERLASMDEGGIDLQILSAAGAGADLLARTEAIRYARDLNNGLAAAVARHPDRLGGFAHLPMTDPEAAADELERAVGDLGFHGAMLNGIVRGRFLDDPAYEPLLARAETLDVPLYLHPSLAPRPVYDAYYSDLPEHVGFMLSTSGWGWHAETALHVLRLVVSGTFERHRKLRMIVGHMGEGLPAMLARCDKVFAPLTSAYLSRSVSETLLEQLWITTSGFFDLPSFMAALLTFGADRILFSVDYPYSPNMAARDFLNRLPLSPDDRAKIAHRNADRLLDLASQDISST